MNPDWTTIHGDCLTEMFKLPADSVDAVVTDPPYGIRFMGKSWDGADIDARAERRRGFDSHAPGAGPNGGHKSIAAEAGKYDLAPAAMRAFQEFSEAWAREALRVLKPGGYLLSFSSARTYHRMTAGIEDAGFEIRDQIMWLYGSGFPKSHNGEWGGTALKPAHEPICVARKPLVGTVEANWRLHRTGALNIDGCRIEVGDASYARNCSGDRGHAGTRGAEQEGATNLHAGGGSAGAGRWPANIVHDGSFEVLDAFPDAKGQQGRVSGGEPTANGFSGAVAFSGMLGRIASAEPRVEIETSAARFFYCAKTSKRDRNEGCEALPQKTGGMVSNTSGQHITRRDEGYAPAPMGNTHPTVKPTDLMAYLCRLVTPPGGTLLDPFLGSGSTGKAAIREGFRFIGIELEEEYLAIARARISHEYLKDIL